VFSKLQGLSYGSLELYEQAICGEILPSSDLGTSVGIKHQWINYSI